VAKGCIFPCRRRPCRPCSSGGNMVVIFVLPVLILLLIAVVPTWPYNRNWGYYPTGGVGAILALTLVLLMMNRI